MHATALNALDPAPDTAVETFPASATAVDDRFQSDLTTPEAPRPAPPVAVLVGASLSPRADFARWLNTVSRQADAAIELSRLSAQRGDGRLRCAAARFLAACLDDAAADGTTRLFALAAVGLLDALEARPTLEGVARAWRGRLVRSSGLPEPEEHFALAVLEHLGAPRGTFDPGAVYAEYAAIAADDAGLARACQRYRGALDQVLGEDTPRRAVHRRAQPRTQPAVDIPWAFDDAPGWCPAPVDQITAARAAEAAVWSQARCAAHRKSDEARAWSVVRRQAHERAEPARALPILATSPLTPPALTRRAPARLSVVALISALLAACCATVALGLGPAWWVPAMAWIVAAAAAVSDRGPGGWVATGGNLAAGATLAAISLAGLPDWMPIPLPILALAAAACCVAILTTGPARGWFAARDAHGLPRLDAGLSF